MYLSLQSETVTEKVIEKSRFLTFTSHVEGEEEAKAFLARVREQHPLATHVCYGLIADKTGNIQRFSDDGEPQGTAGLPILGVVKAQKLFESAVAVVRYFGGVKLGAGGLTRAYASCAAEGIAASTVCEYDGCEEIEITVNYPEADALVRFLEGENASVLNRAFGERAVFTVAVRERDRERFISALQNRLLGKALLKEGKKYFYPFPHGANERG